MNKPYRKYKKTNDAFVDKYENDINKRNEELKSSVKTFFDVTKKIFKIYILLKDFIKYTFRGSYQLLIFWVRMLNMIMWKKWNTRFNNSGVKLIDKDNKNVSVDERVSFALNNFTKI